MDVVSAFYDDLLNLQESLSKQCVTQGTRRLATTVAKRGNRAYEALEGETVPAMSELGKTLSCRAGVLTSHGDGASRTRTGDLLGAIQALSQLSYSPARA
jgi:hypothetical protein